MILTVARKLNFAIFDYIVKHVILLCVGVGQLCCVYMEAVSATSPKTSIPLYGVTKCHLTGFRLSYYLWSYLVASHQDKWR